MNKKLLPTIQGGYYIKARKIQESEIAHCAPCVRELWDWLIMNANHTESKYCGYIVQRGQLFRSIKDMRQGLHWKVGYRKMTYSEDVTKTAMKTLRRLHMITSMKTPRGNLITICNYDYYQNPKNYENPNENPNENLMKTPMTPLTPPSINKNDKNVNNEKKEDIYIAQFELFWKTYPKRIGKAACQKKWLTLKPDAELFQKIIESIPKQIEAGMINVVDLQFCPYPLTWLNQKRYEEDIQVQKQGKQVKNLIL